MVTQLSGITAERDRSQRRIDLLQSNTEQVLSASVATKQRRSLKTEAASHWEEPQV